jgi:tetratricopeptide (TPR) repeat protein
LCGRLPLALRIAGALLRHRPAWSLGHLAGLLRDQYRRVVAISDGERDLATVFDLSYSGLGERQRLLLRRLGLVPGPDADAHAAAALLDTDPDAAASLLEDLVDHNLLIAHALGRYRLHDLIRAYAHTLAGRDPAQERLAAVDRLLQYYMHTAQSASVPIARYPRPAPEGPPPVYAPAVSDFDAAWAWLRPERDNLEAACVYAQSCALHERAVGLAAGLSEVLLADGPFARALELHQHAADIAQRQGRPAAHATALTDLGVARRLTGDLPGSDAALTQALEIYREAGHRHGEATALTALGCIRRLTGNPASAEDALTQALEIYREAGHRHGEATALTALGCVRLMTGNPASAEDILTRALEIFRTIGHRHGEGAARTYLGIARRLTGDLSGATQALTRAQETFRAIGHRHGEANALTELGAVRSLTGDASGAAQALTQAIEVFRATGHRGNEAWALNHYAAAVAAGGDPPRALALYRQALDMTRELNKPDEEAAALEGLGQCHLTIGEAKTATTHLHQALEIYQRLGMGPDAERVCTRLAVLARA